MSLLHSRQREELRKERLRSRSNQKQASEWREKYFAARREVDELAREVRRLEGVPPGERRRLRREAEEELSRKRDEIEALGGELEALDGLYEAKQKELEAKIRTVVEQYSQASEEAAKAQAVLTALKDGIKEIREAERRRRWRTAVWAFILGVVSSAIVSAIIILLAGVPT